MAEDSILGKAGIERPLEGVDVVDALADERALAEQVLVDVRDGARVRVDPGLAPEELRVARTLCSGQARAHARLQDAVAAGDTTLGFVVARTIERVRHRPDELPRGFPRQLGVGVERDDVLDVGQCGDVAYDEREAVAAPAAQQRVEIRKLAALALVTHPDLFRRVPAARAMEQEESISRARCVPRVQLFDSIARTPQKRLILAQRFLRRIGKVRQQAEMQVVITIAEKPDFERFEQLVDPVFGSQKRRDHDEAAERRRKPIREIHPGQRVRSRQQGREPVCKCRRELAGAEHRHESEDRISPAVDAGVDGEHQGNGREERRHRRDGAQVEKQRRPLDGAPHAGDDGEAKCNRLLEFGKAPVNQVVADVRPMIAVAMTWRRPGVQARSLPARLRIP